MNEGLSYLGRQTVNGTVYVSLLLLILPVSFREWHFLLFLSWASIEDSIIWYFILFRHFVMQDLIDGKIGFRIFSCIG